MELPGASDQCPQPALDNGEVVGEVGRRLILSAWGIRDFALGHEGDGAVDRVKEVRNRYRDGCARELRALLDVLTSVLCGVRQLKLEDVLEPGILVTVEE